MFKVRINRAEYSIIPHLWFVNILGKFLLFVEQARHQSVDGDRLTVGGGGAPLRAADAQHLNMHCEHKSHFACCIV